jgi:hypothetical protein
LLSIECYLDVVGQRDPHKLCPHPADLAHRQRALKRQADSRDLADGNEVDMIRVVVVDMESPVAKPLDATGRR